jgi:NitT/TauT family transport system ATP-binding protein
MTSFSSPAARDSAGPAAVHVRAAAMTYPDGTQALRPIELRVEPGDFTTLLGPSGCGKSTLLKMIAGLLAPSEGHVERASRAAGAAGEAEPRIGFVFQAPTLMPWASVAANVRLPLELAGAARAQARERAARALERVGLQGFASALPHALSGGMQMRVSIARSLVIEPELLLLDEPFGALDEITRNALDMELLELWRDRRFAVVFVTHSIQEAVLLSRRVITMAARPGRLLEELHIDEPYPRDPDFAVSERFARYARRLQQSLQRASRETQAAPAAPPA